LNSSPTLIVVVGATAVGKTETAIRLAEYFKTEIISADSRQFYRELTIGTAKPSNEELQRAKHHFIDSHSITENYTVGQFENDALMVLESIFQHRSVAILAGGSGLFVKILCDGMDEIPETDPEIRVQLIAELADSGLKPLLEELKIKDLDYYEEVDKANPQRILRALEVCRSTGLPFSSFRTQKKVKRPFNIIKIGLTRPREELYARIDARMDAMIAQGLLEEAKSLLPFQSHNALQTVGYQEIFAFLNGEYDWEEAVRLLKRNSRRYAKRQLTWFRKDTDIQWFEADKFEDILRFLTLSIQ
jgi:tRNA dimethylallyltransferase